MGNTCRITAAKKIQHEELFVTTAPTWELPQFVHTPIDQAFEEIELFGFSLCSPFSLLRDALPSTLLACQLKDLIQQEVDIVAYLIHVKYTKTSKGGRMYFGTFIDLKGEWVDTVHFPASALQFPFTGPGIYQIKGKVIDEYDFICIVAHWMKRLAVVDRESS